MKIISIIIPIYNEEKNIPLIYAEIKKVWEDLKEKYNYEIIFVDDGSADESIKEMEKLATKDAGVKTIEFSRNFGKEIATTAGINNSKGDAVIMLDADLQHPVDLIPKFLKKWEAGIDVVVGVRNQNKSDDFIKRFGSYVFYKLLNAISEVKVVPQATDFRLLDKIVVNEFNHLTEKDRITRGLIDWLGFKREYIYFDANERATGEASYSFIKLCKLAVVSFISLSLFPLRMAGYLGFFIMIFSGIFGIVMILDRYFTNWGLTFSGTAILANIILFLVGIILISLGLLAFYIGNIYKEVQGRPMYVVRRKPNKSETL